MDGLSNVNDVTCCSKFGKGFTCLNAFDSTVKCETAVLLNVSISGVLPSLLR